MKRYGPPMIDRRCKRLQTRHEVERAAVEDQDMANQDMELELVTFCSVSQDMLATHHGWETACKLAERAMRRVSDEDACTMLKHGSWIPHKGRRHFGYLRDKATGQACSITDLVQAELARRAQP